MYKYFAAYNLSRQTIVFRAILVCLLASVSAAFGQATLQFGASNYSVSEAAEAVIEEVGRNFVLDRKRVCFIGHSGGGSMACLMALPGSLLGILTTGDRLAAGPPEALSGPAPRRPASRATYSLQ